MTRNPERRVEIAAPILSKEHKDWFSFYLDLILMDNVKARELTSLGTYVKKGKNGRDKIVCSSIILTIPSSLQNLRYRKTVSCGDWKDCLQGCKEKKEGKNMSNKQVKLQHVADASVLYHYTKSKGVNGILHSNCFWAIKSDFLNDPKEFSYIETIIVRSAVS